MSDSLSAHKTDRAKDKWAILHAIIQTIGASPDPAAELQRTLARVLEDVLNMEAGWLMLRDETETTLHIIALHRVSADALADWQTMDFQARREHLAARLSTPLIVEDTSFYPELAPLTASGWQCYVGIPLLAYGHPQGLLAALGKGPGQFSAADLDFLTAIGQQLGSALENTRLRISLERAEQRYKALAEFSRDAILLIDQRLRITFASPLAAEFTGHPQEKMVGRDARRLFPADFHDKLVALTRHQVSDTPPARYEVALNTKDGERREIEIISTRAKEGPAVTCLYMRDITERKRAERLSQALKAATIAMQRAYTPQDIFAAMSRKLNEAGIHASIAILDENNQHLALSHLTLMPDRQANVEMQQGELAVGTRFPLDSIPAFQRALADAQAVFIDNAEVSVHLLPWAGELSGHGHWICAPLFIGNKAYGFLMLIAPFLTKSDISEVTAFAHHTAVALENAQHYQAATRRAQELATLNEIGRTVTSTLDLDSLLARTMEGVNQILNVEAGSVLLVDEETGDLVFRVSLQHDEWQKISNLRVPAGTGVVGAVVQQGQPLIVPDTSRDPRFYPKVDKQMSFVTRSILCVPLIVRGQTIGAIEVLNKIGGQFTNEDLDLLTSIAASVGVAIENATLYKAEQNHAEELEARVAERTRDLNLAIEELFERERTQREISEQLRKANREIEAILNSVADGLIVTDGHGYMRMANPRAEELLGFHLENLSGKPIAADDAPCGILRSLAKAISRRPAEAITMELEIPCSQQSLNTPCWKYFQCSREDCPSWGHPELLCWLVPGVACLDSHLPPGGRSADSQCTGCEFYQKLEKLTLQAHSAPIFSEEQYVMGTVTVLRDITRLRELDRLKSKFVSNVSHELRTPLTNIKMYVSLLKSGKPEKQVRYLEIIERESNRLTMLIEDILSLSRLEAREAPPQRTPVEIAEIVESVLSIHQPRAESKAIDLRAQVTPSLPLIEADRNQLVQMLTNLVSNALNYTMEGGQVWVSAFQVQVRQGIAYPVEDKGETLKLPLGRVRDGMWIALSVSDTGIGIPEEDRERIFDRFYRGKVEDLGIPGTGLGLPIVKEILEMHNGHIFVESEEGVGSTFTVLLPVPKVIPAKQPLVLVADDDPMIGEIVGRFLSTAEFQVEVVRDGLEAMNRINSLKPDLLVLDLSMPGMDGYQVLKRLRSDPQTHGLPVLVLSGWEEARGERAITLGANDFLTKPFSGKVLADVVRRLLNLD